MLVFIFVTTAVVQVQCIKKYTFVTDIFVSAQAMYLKE